MVQIQSKLPTQIATNVGDDTHHATAENLHRLIREKNVQQIPHCGCGWTSESDTLFSANLA